MPCLDCTASRGRDSRVGLSGQVGSSSIGSAGSLGSQLSSLSASYESGSKSSIAQPKIRQTSLSGGATVLSRSGSSNSGSSSGSSDSDSSQSVSSPGDSSSGSSSGSGSQSFGSSASILSGKVFTTPASEASDGSSSFDAAKSLEELYVKRHIGLIEPAANGDLDFDRAATPASALSLKLGDTAEKMMERMLPQGAVEKVNRECPAKLCTRSDACPFDGGVCCRSAKFCCPAGHACLTTFPPTCVKEADGEENRCAEDECSPGYHCPYKDVGMCCLDGQSCCPANMQCRATTPSTCEKVLSAVEREFHEALLAKRARVRHGSGSMFALALMLLRTVGRNLSHSERKLARTRRRSIRIAWRHWVAVRRR